VQAMSLDAKDMEDITNDAKALLDEA